MMPATLMSIILVGLWEFMQKQGWLPRFIIPAPSEIVHVFRHEWRVLWDNSVVTLTQAWLGLLIGIALAFVLAFIMDLVSWLNRAIYPLLIISQTIPTVAIAPILVLALGYDMTPKIVLVVLTTLFPIVISLLNGFAHADKQAIQLLELMGASRWAILWHVKLPESMSYFFSGLRVSVSYAFVSSVVAEWLGGFVGLGVYMIQSRKAFSYDKMFAVIVLISLLSLFFMSLVSVVERWLLPWQYQEKKRRRWIG
ncbi:ABC transporter permease [Tuanshanicoccus lijuaniae]|uniref:ABC transporter permease n=1 Tax=Aerococcaceae bacterium zg-1292 TaxID=2774330 RepID=UPI001936A223|nr:ABC transporter permease [Aerococcaceae bacterium zg-1292]QQA38113.1 ABC transporter permease [Aerococcaceae bacterium zg-1292]